jgi:hypothetical protein
MSTASPAANLGPRSLVEAAKIVSMPQFKTQSSELRRVHHCIGQDCSLFCFVFILCKGINTQQRPEAGQASQGGCSSFENFTSS